MQAAEWSAALAPNDLQAQERLAMGYARLGQHYELQEMETVRWSSVRRRLNLDNQFWPNHPDRVECYRALSRAHNGMGSRISEDEEVCQSRMNISKQAVEAFEELSPTFGQIQLKFDVEYSMFQMNLALIKTELEQYTEALELLASARPRLEAALENSPSDQQVENSSEGLCDRSTCAASPRYHERLRRRSENPVPLSPFQWGRAPFKSGRVNGVREVPACLLSILQSSEVVALAAGPTSAMTE